jgi:hypothetical protein
MGHLPQVKLIDNKKKKSQAKLAFDMKVTEEFAILACGLQLEPM